MNIAELKKKGVNVDSIVRKTNLIYVLCDIIESANREIKEELKVKECFRHEPKFHINAIISHCSKMVKIVDRTVTENESEMFGDDADTIKEKLYELCKIT